MLLNRFREYPMLSKKILGVMLLIVFLVAILEIWLVNRLSNYGEEIAKIELTQTVIALQNEILKNQIDSYSSLRKIENQSQELGFQTMRNVQYLQPVDVASR